MGIKSFLFDQLIEKLIENKAKFSVHYADRIDLSWSPWLKLTDKNSEDIDSSPFKIDKVKFKIKV